MPREVPLKTVKTKGSEDASADERRAKSSRKRISPYDIILGKIDLNYQEIPTYMYVASNPSNILKEYQKECEKEARYMEAEMAKHRINDLKKYMYEFKKEIITNYHLKEVRDLLIAEM